MERTIILYHTNCPDGFGGAYAAWKKFGDSAEYRPLSYGKPVPEDLAGAHIFFIDCCYEQEKMDAIKAETASLIVLDHHEGTQEIVESIPGSVYDVSRSGATIAWGYFHPDTPVPTLLKHIEDDDLFLFKLEDTRPLLAYVAVRPFNFAAWDELASLLDHPAEAADFFAKVRIYREYFDLLVELSVARAELVTFEGHTVYVGQCHPFKPMVSALGNALATKQGPLALVVQIQTLGISVSMRGDGLIDLTEIAQKYGGNGHISSAAFLVPWGTPLPWTPVPKEDETPRN